jgi:hypothetical protein
MTRKQVFSSVLVFTIGFLSGLILLTLLSSAACKAYLADMQLQFRADQSIKAIQAIRDGDTVKALVSQQNVVDTFNPESYAFLNDNAVSLNFWSAIQLYLLEEIKESTYSPQGNRLFEGLEHGKLAYVLDNLGMKLKADEEWIRAVELAGYSNKKDAFKMLISQMIEAESPGK